MVTYKSLIVICALLVALAGAGLVAASAHTLAPAQQQHNMQPYQAGVAAIPIVASKHKQVSFQDVRHYIKTKGFIGGSTLSGRPPTLKDLQLTSLVHLDHLFYSILAQMPGDKQVYYAQLDGPFLVLPQLPVPVLCTLLPSASNLPAFIPHLSNLSSLGLLNGSSLLNLLPLSGLLPQQPLTLPGSHKIDNVTSFHDSFSVSDNVPDLSDLQNIKVPLNDDDTRVVLSSVYEIFDAHNGNLLAWG
ncbi:MAG TPA: hypothetical protein VGD98_22405 [Ktedonobacteraceae bacterium]